MNTALDRFVNAQAREDPQALAELCAPAASARTRSGTGCPNCANFLAPSSGALAAQGIACHLVSAFHHDHLFVAANMGVHTLKELSILISSN